MHSLIYNIQMTVNVEDNYLYILPVYPLKQLSLNTFEFSNGTG